MFVGAINATVRTFLGNVAGVFNNHNVIVGCSGNFTSEAVLAAYSQPASVHSNDVSFYSCMAGAWLTGSPLRFEIADEDYRWLESYFDSDTSRLAAIMVLLDMLDFDKRNTIHRKRMWQAYLDGFDTLHEQTVEKLDAVSIPIASYFAGDVFDHFQRFGDDPNAIFCCYAPTYSGGYERLYKRLEEIVTWEEPTYSMLDEDARNRLLAWMAERKYLWYDDRVIEGLTPVMKQRSGRSRTVYLYSNVVTTPAVFDDRQPANLPNLPLAHSDLTLTAKSRIWLHRIKASNLGRFKDAFLGKNIDFSQGMWAFAVVVDGWVVGFLEFSKAQFGGADGVYMLADFAIPGTRYKRLSKLVVMLSKSGETRRWLERAQCQRTRSLMTTAFTERPVSMKYRGILKLQKRGQTDSGEQFLNYGAVFDNLTWQEVYNQWWTKHGSKTS